jgi:YD repeat-containing protein
MPARATRDADSPPPTGAVSAEQAGTTTGRANSDIPADYVPPPGMCRVWVPGEPAEEQASRFPAGRCSVLRTTLPEDAWLIYRPTDDSGRFRAWQYDGDGQVRAQRLYDLATGRLIRHIAPASGN